MEALTARLENLEAIVGVQGERATAGVVSTRGSAGGGGAIALTQRVKALARQLAELGAHDRAPRLLALSGRTHDACDDPRAARAVLSARVDRVAQIGHELQVVHELSRGIDSEQIADVAGRRSEVLRFSPLILAQAHATAELGAQLQEYLEAYNEAAAAMSDTVLELDARISHVAQRRKDGGQ